MYLTSSDLLQHIQSDHCLIKWACDYCDGKVKEQSFVFESRESWETHMLQAHPQIASAQLPSLERVSRRSMAGPISCPLCAFEGDGSGATLDNHIAQHLHEFALRCLPWGTSGNDRDSVNTKSAGGPLSDGLSNTNEESVFVDEKFCETENPGDISWRLENLFRFFESPQYEKFLSHRRHIPDGRDLSEQLSSVTEKYKERYYAGTMSPSTAEAVSSKLRKLLLMMREGLGIYDYSRPSDTESSLYGQLEPALIFRRTVIHELEFLEAKLMDDSGEPDPLISKSHRPLFKPYRNLTLIGIQSERTGNR
ncbi:hypothetical protein BO86DRAFT_149144 [Aspergillus japonicus CBS 114.51]|uniref:Uncharacterized protein n=1 Tax=Aspergillus japonicus CBS 114.51 TaxID=1448312 RepID=A0A8T8WUI3_ASPJA|nr:hypothetical protein BO86DRAFT_149144 [Aspergillus japonicus CBS 114.51]RAH79507.1 hypothetical protein BO86DRAFT_149144 [Aspergillus japonicus CBS 114.51]